MDLLLLLSWQLGSGITGVLKVVAVSTTHLTSLLVPLFSRKTGMHVDVVGFNRKFQLKTQIVGAFVHTGMKLEIANGAVIRVTPNIAVYHATCVKNSECKKTPNLMTPIDGQKSQLKIWTCSDIAHKITLP